MDLIDSYLFVNGFFLFLFTSTQMTNQPPIEVSATEIATRSVKQTRKLALAAG